MGCGLRHVQAPGRFREKPGATGAWWRHGATQVWHILYGVTTIRWATATAQVSQPVCVASFLSVPQSTAGLCGQCFTCESVHGILAPAADPVKCAPTGDDQSGQFNLCWIASAMPLHCAARPARGPAAQYSLLRRYLRERQATCRRWLCIQHQRVARPCASPRQLQAHRGDGAHHPGAQSPSPTTYQP